MRSATNIRPFPQLFAGLTILSLSLIGTAFVGRSALQEFKAANDVLTVTGSAKRAIESDYIIVSFSISSQEPTARESYQSLKNQRERVKAYLQARQVSDEAIKLGSISTYAIPQRTYNGQETGKILAHRLTQRIEIRSNDVDKYTELSQQLNELIEAGVNIVVFPPQYLYTQLGQLRVEMVAEATKDAKARAVAIAQTTGNQVGVVRSAKTGVFQITSRHSTAVSDYGIYDTSSLDKDITAVVSVQFSLK
ncbi:MAG: SIMPL domain-containing protein [Prochloraceae cyanobacterium]